jgi:hypothetical protein
MHMHFPQINHLGVDLAVSSISFLTNIVGTDSEKLVSNNPIDSDTHTHIPTCNDQ